jgi:MoxR-like ATPase
MYPIKRVIWSLNTLVGAALTQSEASESPRSWATLLTRLRDEISGAIQGKDEIFDFVLTTLLANGHVLIEDVPGVGKTTLAQAVAASLGCSFRRIQFTADMLPSDLIGVSIFNQQSQAFEFRPGPLFAQVVLADEINRTSPRTQSALLEAMNEGQITVDRETHQLAAPFLVLATQNPLESYGTYPLPDSQFDRFLMRIHIGYPPDEVEKEILRTRKMARPVESLQPVVSPEELLAMQRAVDEVTFDPELLDYLYALIKETRQSSFLSVGVSTRGALQFHRAIRAYAFLQGRRFVLPDDLKKLAVPCLAHRVTPQQQLGQGGWSPTQQTDTEQIIAEILDRVPVPL